MSLVPDMIKFLCLYFKLNQNKDKLIQKICINTSAIDGDCIK